MRWQNLFYLFFFLQKIAYFGWAFWQNDEELLWNEWLAFTSWKNIYLHTWFLFTTVAFEEMVSLILDGFINPSSSDTLVSMCRSAQIFPKINDLVSRMRNWMTDFGGFRSNLFGWKQWAGSSVMRKAICVTTLLPLLTPSLTLRLENGGISLCLQPSVRPVWACKCLLHQLTESSENQFSLQQQMLQPATGV